MTLFESMLPIAAGMLVLAMAFSAWRLLRGPGLADRVLALDTLYINLLALLVVVGIVERSQIYFEAALLIALLGFVGTLCVARFITRGNIIG